MCSRNAIVVTLVFALGCASAPVAADPQPVTTAAPPVVVDAGTPEVCAPRETGPYAMPFDEHAKKRSVYFVAPSEASCAKPTHRLIANLHGLCNPPGYACGYWTGAASARGFLV